MDPKPVDDPSQGHSSGGVCLLEQITPLARQINCLDIDRIADVCVTKIPQVVGSRSDLRYVSVRFKSPGETSMPASWRRRASGRLSTRNWVWRLGASAASSIRTTSSV